MLRVAFLLALYLPALAAADDGELAAKDGDGDSEQGVEPVDCCVIELFPAQLEGYRSACREENPALEEDRRCADECMLKPEGLLDENGGLRKPNFMELMRFKEGNEGEPEVNMALEKCLDWASDDEETETKCKSGAADIILCLMREVFLNCPETFWKTSKGCSELLEKVKGSEDLEVIL